MNGEFRSRDKMGVGWLLGAVFRKVVFVDASEEGDTELVKWSVVEVRRDCSVACILHSVRTRRGPAGRYYFSQIC
jgi:hypothetical protein